MKRILAFLLVSVMLLSMSAFARLYPFTDLKDDQYYAEPAKYLYEEGIMSGYEDGTFKADRIVTRAEMAALICRLMGAEEYAQTYYKGKTTDATQDVSANHWASGYIAFAVDYGIISGDGNGRFRPEDKVSYNEAYKLIVCAVGLDDEVEHVPGDWAKGYVEVACNYGINWNVLYLTDKLNRGDAAVMFYNALNNVSFEYDFSIEEEEPDDDDDYYYEEDIFDDWDEYDRFDENGNLITYTLTVKMSGCGGIVNTGGKYPAGDNVPLYIYPGTEDAFIGWTASAGVLWNADQPTGVITMPNEDVVVYAQFTEDGSAVRVYDEDEDWYYFADEYDDSDDYDDDDDEYEEVGEDSFVDEVIRLVNIEREKEGLKPLSKSEKLCEVAEDHSIDMSRRNFFSHTNPDGESPYDRMGDRGIKYSFAGENIAKGQSTPVAVVQAWMSSDGHRANILNPKFKNIGVGFCGISYGYVWTQCFTG